MQNQQQCAQNSATPRRGESDEARPDQKTEEGCSASLGRWPAIVVQHLYVPPTCTGFLREMLWSLGSFVAERERPSIFQPFYSASNVDDGVPEPQQKPVLCECDVGVIQQPAQSAQLMQFDVEHREDEENGTEELHAVTDDKDVAALHTTTADGSGDEQRKPALIERHRANSEPEANYGPVTTTRGAMPVTLMHWVRVDIGAWRSAGGQFPQTLHCGHKLIGCLHVYPAWPRAARNCQG
ncbi:uncharacterized protein LOC125943274 [Dermacentor silvarum]|uniref:uncharacterized protein LOC125943274 n=1 Tax=Dermacentor silvarum TaxID=543639 RepID=UPI002100CA3C|nr:uncharacterized protein LOC125943274 [Dermacentor silvarum]